MNKYELAASMLNPSALEYKRAKTFFYFFMVFSIVCFFSIEDAELVGTQASGITIPLLGISMKMKTVLYNLYWIFPLVYFFVSFRLYQYLQRVQDVMDNHLDVHGDMRNRILFSLEPVWLNNIFTSSDSLLFSSGWVYGVLSIFFIPFFVFSALVALGFQIGFLLNEWKFLIGAPCLAVSLYSFILIPLEMAKVLKLAPKKKIILTYKKWWKRWPEKFLRLLVDKIGEKRWLSFIVLTPVPIILAMLCGGFFVEKLDPWSKLDISNASLMTYCNQAMHEDIQKGKRRGNAKNIDNEYIRKFCRGGFYPLFKFSKADLRFVKAHKCLFDKTKFQNANGFGGDFRNSFFLSANLRGADFEMADFSHASFENVRFDYVNLENADLTNVIIKNPFTTIEGTNIHGAKMSDALRCWFEENGSVSMPSNEYRKWRKIQFKAQGREVSDR